MEMLVTPEWLRNKTNTEPDIDIEAGIPTQLLRGIDAFLPPGVVPVSVEDIDRALELKHAFGVLVRSLRLRDSLTVEELAAAATVMVDDIESIERDPRSEVRPRTVFKLAKVFRIEPSKMIKISGTTVPVDEELACETLKFAAKSDGVSCLNAEEQQVLGAFIQYLNKA